MDPAASASAPARSLHVVPRIAASILVTALIVVCARAAAMGKELFVAFRFGTASSLDAFLVAVAVPTFFANVVTAGISVALIPELVRAKMDGGRPASVKLLRGALTLACAGLALATLLLAVTAPLLLRLLAPGLPAARLDLAVRLFYVLLPSVPLTALSNLFASVLNAERRFALVASTPAISSISIVLAAVLLRNIDTYALAVGTVGGLAVECCVRAAGAAAAGYSPVPGWHGYSAPLRRVVRQYIPALAGTATSSSSPLVDQAVASFLAVGSISSLAFANRFVGLAMTVGAASVGAVLLPQFSSLAASHDWTGFRRTLRRWIGVVLAATIPITAFLIAESSPLTRILYQRGAFTATSTSLVAHVQVMYALQLPFHLAGVLGVRALNALSANTAIMRISVVNLVVNVVADVTLVHYMGLPGIALSTSVVYLVSFTLIFMALRRRLRALASSSIVSTP